MEEKGKTNVYLFIKKGNLLLAGGLIQTMNTLQQKYSIIQEMSSKLFSWFDSHINIFPGFVYQNLRIIFFSSSDNETEYKFGQKKGQNHNCHNSKGYHKTINLKELCSMNVQFAAMFLKLSKLYSVLTITDKQLITYLQ